MKKKKMKEKEKRKKRKKKKEKNTVSELKHESYSMCVCTWSSKANSVRFFFAEVDRAVDNLVKSGKMFNPPRRDSMPMMPGAVPRFPVEQHGMLQPPPSGGKKEIRRPFFVLLTK